MTNVVYLCLCGQRVEGWKGHTCPGLQVTLWDCARCGRTRCESWRETRALKCPHCHESLEELLSGTDVGESVHVVKCLGCGVQVDDPEWKTEIFYDYEPLT